LSDEALAARLQRAAFSYFEDRVNPATGLVADTSRSGSPSSIAVVGLALSCYPIAVERGWLSRARAAEITHATLRFLWESPQGDSVDMSGYKGFYYHFLEMTTGRRVWGCELSIVDTALLFAGVLTAGAYFTGSSASASAGTSASTGSSASAGTDAGMGAGADPDAALEARIRDLADRLYRRVDWQWARDPGGAFAQGWKPECGFLHYGWEGYNEATIAYVLGLGSPTHPLPATSFAAWTSTYQWEHLLGFNVLYSGPLFTHLFSHAWLDYRGIQDAFMREKGCDYFINTQRSIALHREYAVRNPHGFVGYGPDLWGLTAGDGPSPRQMRRTRRDLRFYGYMARGAPYGPDDGTLAPWAMLATLPFAPTDALRGVRNLLAQYPEACREERFASGLNPSCTDGGRMWLSDGWYGLDQGLLVLMIENHLSGLPWRLMQSCPYVRAGLRSAGFSGGWLDTAS
jgi:hypothetical protein